MSVPRVSHPRSETSVVTDGVRQRVLSGARSIVEGGVRASRATSSGWQISPARGEVSRKIVQTNRPTDGTACGGAVIWSRAAGRRVRRSAVPLSRDERVYHEEIANDRSDSLVSERTSERSIAEERREGGRTNGRKGARPQRRRKIGFRVHAYSSAQGTRKWVNPTQRRPFSRASHSVA